MEAAAGIPDLVSAALGAEARGDPSVSADLFGLAAEMDPTSADLRLWQGVRLMAASRWEEARASLERAQVLAPERKDIWTYLSSAQARTGQVQAARANLRGLLATSPNSSELWSGLIELERIDGDADGVRSTVSAALDALPNDGRFAAFAGSVLLAEGLADEALAAFSRAIALEPMSGPTTFEGCALAALRSSNEPGQTILAQLEEGLARLPEEETLATLVAGLRLKSLALAAWTAFTNGDEVEPAHVERLAAAPFEAVRLVFANQRKPREIRTDDEAGAVEALGRPLADAFALHRAGFDPDVWFEKHPELGPHARPQSATFQRRALCQAAGRLQDEMLRDGALVLVSPLDGEQLSAVLGIVLEYLRPYGIPHAGSGAAYLMSGGETAFVLFSGEDNWPMAWWYPQRRVLVRERGFIEIDDYLLPNIVDLQTLLVRNQRIVAERITGRRPLRPAMVVGSNDFISTHLFEDLSGVERALLSGAAERVAETLVSCPEYYGLIEELFPEIVTIGAPITRVTFEDAEDYNQYLWSRDLFPVRVAGGFATSEVAERVMVSAAQFADPEWRADVSALAADRFPLIMISLRTHGRCWEEPPEAVASMLDGLCAAYPSAAFIFDGHAQTSAETGPPAPLAAELKLLGQITAAMKSCAPVRVSAGRTLADGIFAAGAVHCHLSVQGTSTTKPVLIANKPGVVIGPAVYWWDVRNYRESVAEQIVLSREAQDLSPSDWVTTSFKLDPERVLDALKACISRNCRQA